MLDTQSTARWSCSWLSRETGYVGLFHMSRALPLAHQTRSAGSGGVLLARPGRAAVRRGQLPREHTRTWSTSQR